MSEQLKSQGQMGNYAVLKTLGKGGTAKVKLGYDT